MSRLEADLSNKDMTLLEERRNIAKAIVLGANSEELMRDWIQYDGRNYERSPSVVAALTDSSGSTGGGRDNSETVSVEVNQSSARTSPMGRPPNSRPLSLVSTSASFPARGSNDYLNYDNILTPPECFLERRQLLIDARKRWLESVVGQQGVERVEAAISAAGGPSGAGTTTHALGYGAGGHRRG